MSENSVPVLHPSLPLERLTRIAEQTANIPAGVPLFNAYMYDAEGKWLGKFTKQPTTESVLRAMVNQFCNYNCIWSNDYRNCVPLTALCMQNADGSQVWIEATIKIIPAIAEAK